MKVALFITCLADTFYPRAGIAVVKVLEHLGCQVEFPVAQTCCGQPMWNNGFCNETRELAKRMIDVFEPYEHVVTPSGSCAAMIRDYYPEIFKGDHAYGHACEQLVDRTYEFVEYLVKVLKVDLQTLNASWAGKVTYHYSCHLRGIGIRDEAVQVIKQIDGAQYTPLVKAEQCCGFGGTFAIKYPQISGAMVRDKVGCIRDTQAETVISNDAGCTMNIAGACHREGLRVGFKSLAEVIAESLGLLKRTEMGEKLESYNSDDESNYKSQ